MSTATATTLRWAVRLLWLRAAAFGAWTLYLGYATFRYPEAWLALPVACFTGLTTAVLIAVGMWLRRSGWARGAAVLVELLQLLTGAWAWAAGSLVIGVPLMAMSVAGLVLVLAPNPG